MFQVYRKELMWGGRPLILETGKLARQADGAVVATYGETTVLCTAVAMKAAKPGQDFFPLTVNYQEKTFAAGKIPGGFIARLGEHMKAFVKGNAADAAGAPFAKRMEPLLPRLDGLQLD